MRKKLTTKTVDSLRPAKGKRYEVRDALVPGLLIRVYRNGDKVWNLLTRVEGRQRRFTLGRYPVISLSDARERAQGILRDVALGRHAEVAPGSPEALVPTLGETIPRFIELHAKPHTKDWKGSLSILQKFASLHARPLDEIRRADVIRVLDAIVASGTPARANRALAAIKKLMNWSVNRGVIEVSPVTGLRPPAKEVARDRVLNHKELEACWKEAIAEGFPFGPFTQMLILTGQRRGEVAGMRWSELDLENGTWTIPSNRAKNATAHIVPLAPIANEILVALQRFQGSDFVFTTTGTSAISGFGRLKRRLDEAVGHDVEDWRLHDIRRTVATNMAMMGFQPHIIEAVLNHKSGIVSGVAAIYNRHGYQSEKREALEAWAEHAEKLINSKTGQSRAEASEPRPPHRLSADGHHFSQPTP